MALLSSLHFICASPLPAESISSSPLSAKIEAQGVNPWRLRFSARGQNGNRPGLPENGNRRRIWRRRKLTKKDDMLEYKMERIPFLEEQVRKIKDDGKLMTMDIERLMLSQENRFDFVNEVAAEAKAYVEKNRDEYGTKKPILHVLSNRMNEAGFYRPVAYMESDPFKPGPTYIREEDI